MAINESEQGREPRGFSLLSKENMLAVALCFILILLIVMTSSSAPQWIYQGF